MNIKKLQSEPATYSINPKTFEEFEKYVKENFIDKSRLVESLITNYLKSKQ